MSLEFPLEKRKIGRFDIEILNNCMVSYNSLDKSNALYMSKKIKEGLQNSGLTPVDIYSHSNDYEAFSLDDSDIRFMIAISCWHGTNVSVYIQERKIEEWRPKFKERLADLEKILEAV